jgi:hypothetical protein
MGSAGRSSTQNAVFFLGVCGDPRHQRKQDLTGLAPKGCVIAAQAIEREVGQIGHTQKASRFHQPPPSACTELRCQRNDWPAQEQDLAAPADSSAAQLAFPGSCIADQEAFTCNREGFSDCTFEGYSFLQSHVAGRLTPWHRVNQAKLLPVAAPRQTRRSLRRKAPLRI